MHSRFTIGLGVAAAAGLLLQPRHAAAAPPLQPALQVRWSSGLTEAVEGMSIDELRREVRRLIPSKASTAHVLVHFERPPDPTERARLAAAGLTLQHPVGSRSYFARLLRSADATMVSHPPLLAVQPIRPAHKLHADLAAGILRPWTLSSLELEREPRLRELAATGMVTRTELVDAGLDPVVAVLVMFHPDADARSEATRLARLLRGRVVSHLASVNAATIHLRASSIDALADDDAVMWIEPPLPRMEDLNASNRELTGVDVLNAAPYGLDGAGVNVLVFDGGKAAAHGDLAGRLTYGQSDTDNVTGHATHVATTVGGDGAGSVDQIHRGMAPGVQIISYGFQVPGGLLPGFLYTDPGDIEADYTEAIQLHGAHIANNSIGSNTASNGFPCEWTGNYGITSALIDSIVSGSLGGPFRVVWANGNERNHSRCLGNDMGEHGEYYSTAPPATAKNHITVGAVNSDTDEMTGFSSWGPTDDGRLKPDICAPGCQVRDDGGVTSGNSSGGYSTACGTSMAAPTATGVLALVLQQYRETFPGRPDPLNATLKALLANTAVDLGTPGPDYAHGYGSIRAVAAVDAVMAGNLLEGAVVEGAIERFDVVHEAGAGALRVTMAWDDPYAVPNTPQALVNDLDLRIVAPDGTVYLPWTLNPHDPAAPAVQTVPDTVNNIEQVVVEAAAAGIYTVEVRGGIIRAGASQSFGLVSSATLHACSSRGKVALSRSVVGCDDTVDITITDCDLNASVAVVESAFVEVLATTGTYQVELYETGPATGQFSGTLAISSEAGTGVLVTPGEAVEFVYLDEDDGTGLAALRSATLTVDCTPPALLSTGATDIWYNHATISALVDEPVTCEVIYGLDLNTSAGTVSGHVRDVAHSIHIPDLVELTNYVYALRLTDAAGNITLDDNNGEGYPIHTIEGPRAIHQFLVDDTNPGWATTGDWQFGQPAGLQGDPDSGYSGLNVYGYNLNGYFPWHMGEEYLTSTLIDCTGAYETRLEFQRWLGLTPDVFSAAKIEARAGGGDWQLIWKFSGGRLSPDEWTHVQYLIADVADNQPDLQLRWTMGPSTVHADECGWNLDDIIITAVTPPPTLQCPGDATGDDRVDFDDLNVVLSNWSGPGPEGDIHPPGGDGMVNFDDLNAILLRWGQGCR